MDPFITKQDKEELSKVTGLSKMQIMTWFSNQRKKQRKIAGSAMQGTV